MGKKDRKVDLGVSFSLFELAVSTHIGKSRQVSSLKSKVSESLILHFKPVCSAGVKFLFSYRLKNQNDLLY